MRKSQSGSGRKERERKAEKNRSVTQIEERGMCWRIRLLGGRKWPVRRFPRAYPPR